MVTKLFAAFLLSSALLSGTAMAQTSSPPTLAPSATAVPATSSDLWRAMKFSGLDVYNDKDEKIGDVSELMLDKTGKIDTVVISVGGFLGMGQHDVAVKFSDLKFMTEPRKAPVSANAPATTTGSANTPPMPTATQRPAEPKNYPEYAVLPSATKDSLKAMPAFKY